MSETATVDDAGEVQKIHAPEYGFLRQAGRAINSGQSRSLVLSGNVNDLFYLENAAGGAYVPLTDFLTSSWNRRGRMVIVYELNGPIRFMTTEDKAELAEAWETWSTGEDALTRFLNLNWAKKDKKRKSLEDLLGDAVGKPTLALELLRQLCITSHARLENERPLIKNKDLIIIIEHADMMIPAGEITRMSEIDRQRVAICKDWFSEPSFLTGRDTVVMLTESASLLSDRVRTMPQLMTIEVPAPDEVARRRYISWFNNQQPDEKKVTLSGSEKKLGEMSAGLTIHALRQLMIDPSYNKEQLTPKKVVKHLEAYLTSQMGDGTVEMKLPKHLVESLVGAKKYKLFITDELIPDFQYEGKDAHSGMVVAGANGTGKTYIFEAMAAELDMPVLVLKNLRSMWFGETDVIFERLRRVLSSLSKVLIFVDEADTQFGSLTSETHSTERRLTGKVQSLMSDSGTKGRILWLFMTARIDQLPADIIRAGRMGDLIIPVLDPDKEERLEFLKWMLEEVIVPEELDAAIQALELHVERYSPAEFNAVRSLLKRRAKGTKLPLDRVVAIVRNRLAPPISMDRRYQELQALVHCTSRNLLPNPDLSDEDLEKERQAWYDEIRQLEMSGDLR